VVWLRLRRWVVRPIVWSLAATAFILLCLRAFLASDFARERLAARLEQQLSQLLERDVRLGRLDFELLPFGVRIEEFSISGPKPDDPLFLTVRRLRVDADLDAIRRNEIDLQTVSAEGVRVHVELYPDGGDNLPRVRSSGGGSRFEIKIGGLFVEDGEFELDDARLPLALEAHAILVRLSGLGGTDLSGNVTAQDVVTTLPRAVPWHSTLSAKVTLREDRVEIHSARLRSARLDALVAGAVGWRGGTNGEVAGVVDTEGAMLDELGYLEGEIAGPLRFDGRVRFARRDLTYDGQLTSDRVEIFGFRLEQLAGRVDGDRKAVGLALERGAYGGGAVSGRFDVDFEKPGPLARLAIRADGPRLRAVLEDLELPSPAFSSSAHGDLLYEFPLNDSRRGVGSASMALLAEPPERPGEVPARGTALLELLEGRIELTDVMLDSAAQTVGLRGAYDLVARAGDLDLSVTSADLGELARLQPFLATQPPPLWLPDAGRGTLTAEVRLATGAPAVALALELSDVHAPGGSAERATGSLVVDGDAVRDLDLLLTKGVSSLELRGELPLSAGAASASRPPVALDLAFAAWPVAEVRPWLPAPIPITGAATGSLHLGGTLDEMTGQLAGAVVPATVAGLGFDRLEADLDWNADRLRVRRAELASPSGAVAASGELAFDGDRLAFVLDAERLDLAAAPWSGLTGARLGGSAAVHADLGGTLSAPRLVLDAQLADLGVRDAESGNAVLDVRFAGLLHAELADRRLQANLELPGLLSASGGGPFAPGESGELRFRVASDRLDRLFAIAAGRPLDSLTGTVQADVDVRFAPETPVSLTLRAPELELAYGTHRLRPLEPVEVVLTGQQLVFSSIYLGEAATGDELFLSGRIDLSAAEPALDLRVQAGMSVDWVEQFVGLDLSGQIDLLATVKGTVGRPELNGQASLAGARYIPARFPHSFDRVEALVLLYPGTVVLDHLRSDLAGGTVAATGRLDFPARGEPLSYRAQIATRGTSLRYPEGWLVRGDGDFTLQSTAEGRQIAGALELDRVYYLRDINLSPRQLAERVLSRTRVQVDETDELLGTTYLNLSIVAPRAVRVRNNLANINGSANLALRGSLATPVLFGEVTADAGGTIDYNGSTYHLERGVLTFANPSRIDPLLDVVARTKINEYQVTLAVLGSLSRPTTTFGSDPPLPDYDVLSLLATGSSTGLADFSENAQGAGTPGLAAESLLYGQAAALVSQRVGKLFGVDRLRIDPLAGGDSLSAARVTVGKRLSSRVYLTYSVDPSSTAQQVLQVEWKISDELTLVLTQNGDESYAVDARWERRF
jgi:translocation and assembly module TamB